MERFAVAETGTGFTLSREPVRDASTSFVANYIQHDTGRHYCGCYLRGTTPVAISEITFTGGTDVNLPQRDVAFGCHSRTRCFRARESQTCPV
jgi:hypothetical protein